MVPDSLAKSRVDIVSFYSGPLLYFLFFLPCFPIYVVFFLLIQLPLPLKKITDDAVIYCNNCTFP